VYPFSSPLPESTFHASETVPYNIVQLSCWPPFRSSTLDKDFLQVGSSGPFPHDSRNFLFDVQPPVTVPYNTLLRPSSDFLNLTDPAFTPANFDQGNTPSQVCQLTAVLGAAEIFPERRSQPGIAMICRWIVRPCASREVCLSSMFWRIIGE
jgi:hypothetical protein